MLTYQLRERRIQFVEGQVPAFPADVVLQISMEPRVPFGGVPGVTLNAVKGQEFKARANLSSGRFLIETRIPLFAPLDANAAVDGTTFSIAGNTATVRARCDSLQDLSDLLAALYYAFPAVLTLYLPDAPHALYAWGSVADKKFQWHYEPTEIRGSATVTSKSNQEQLVLESWTQVRHVAPSRRLTGALIYFHTACRLLNAGRNRFEFVAESLLNMSKCLQALFGESRDAVRTELARLGGYTEEEIEGKFITAMVLRSEFDVSHVSLSLLTRGQLAVLHRYTRVAEPAFRDLLKRVIARVSDGTYSLLPDTDEGLGHEKQAILDRIDRNTQGLD